MELLQSDGDGFFLPRMNCDIINGSMTAPDFLLRIYRLWHNTQVRFARRHHNGFNIIVRSFGFTVRYTWINHYIVSFLKYWTNLITVYRQILIIICLIQGLNYEKLNLIKPTFQSTGVATLYFSVS